MRVLPLLGVLLATAVSAAPAAASELIEVDLPSSGHVDPAKVRFNGEGHPGVLRANVLLPDGFDPAKRYPVLYLLHGAGENYRTWVRKTKADEAARGLQAIVVMPDAATGFYTNWWNGGRRGDPGWERYFLDEVIPAIERRFPIRAGRRWHAVAGFSMGGFGSAYLASQRPDYFGSSGPMSGFLAPRRPHIPYAFQAASGQSYEAIYGPPDGHYVAGHDPVFLAPNLRHTRLFVISGNGVPDPRVPQPAPRSIATGAIGEAEFGLEAQEFAAAAEEAGADVTLTILPGIHDHPYWNEHLRRLLAWDPFAPVEETPDRWSYTTVAGHGRAWELTYAFGEPPETVQTLGRDGDAFAARGSGTVELCDSAGRGLVAALPFDGARLERAVDVRILDRRLSELRRAGRVRVALRAREAATVTLSGRLVAGRTRTAALRGETLRLAAGEARTASVTLGAAARRAARDERSARLRLVARHGSCPGGRWTTAARTLRR